MERKLASVQVIKDIKPIKDADNLELAFILGWQVVVKKGQFHKGDKCVYCEIDSILPEREEFEFLRNGCWNEEYQGFRIKTKKLRGKLSQGICFGLTDLNLKKSLPINEDLTEELNIKKYDSSGSNGIGEFHHSVPKTDEIRIQTVYDELMENHKNDEAYITIKLDGSSFTIVKESGEIKLYSRNLQVSENSTYGRCFNELKLNEKLKGVDNIALQGELVGPGVNGNRQKLDKLDFYVFNIFDLTQLEFIEFHKMNEMLNDLNIKMVPILDENFILDKTLDELLELADGKCLINDCNREGIVIRDKKRNWSFKVISNKYLLKNDL